MKQSVKPPKPQPQPATTEALPSSRRPSDPLECAVTSLRDLDSGEHYKVPNKFQIGIGREDSNDIILSHISVSRFHAHAYPHADHLEIHDAVSRNMTFVGRTAVTNLQLFPAGIVRFAEVETMALSEVIEKRIEVLDRLLGLDATVNAALRAPHEHRCLVFAGPSGSCLDQIVAASHGAASEGRTPLIMRAPTRLPANDVAIRALVDEVRNGWFFLDLRKRRRGLQPKIDEALLEQLLARRQGATVAVAIESDEPSPELPGVLAALRPALIVVPSIKQRIDKGGLPRLVDQIYKADGLRLRFCDLHSDVVKALEKEHWDRNYEQLWDVLVYSGRLRVRHRNAGAGIITAAGNANYWINKLAPRDLWGIP